MIFVRHPQTDAPEGLCYGRFDPPLLVSHEDAAARIEEQLRERHDASDFEHRTQDKLEPTEES